MKYQPQQVNTPSNTPSGIPTLDASGGRWEFNPITKQYQYIPAAPAVDQNQGIRNVATGEGGMGPSEAPGFSEPTAGVSSDMAQGGLAGLHHQTNTYAAGGRLLRGPGDGMSDSIPAVIKGARPQRAALADGEFVVPADVVSHLGNGSTEAGSKHLYKMMDRIRKARTGNPKQGKQINANKFLPA